MPSKGKSPTARSLDLLRREGWQAQVVEKWNPFAKVRQDLFGFIDIVAVRDGQVLGVQATTVSNMAARKTKSLSLTTFYRWCGAAQFQVWGWEKVGRLWQVRRHYYDGVGWSDPDGAG
jgi:hypothetical protein